jgi:hypothetical protein
MALLMEVKQAKTAVAEGCRKADYVVLMEVATRTVTASRATVT